MSRLAAVEQESEYKQWNAENCYSEMLGGNQKHIFTLKEGGGCGGHLKKRAITLMIYIFITEKVHPIKENVGVLNSQRKKKKHTKLTVP